MTELPANVVIENFSAAGVSLGKVTVPRIVKTEAEWKALLPEDSFYVTRHEGTERPYSGQYNDNHADGLYRCICCDTALFDSRTKFESGTGWPSFWKPISSANVREFGDNTTDDGTHRGVMPALRCAPGPCVRRRAGSDRPALLHELGGAQIRSAGVKGSATCAARLRAGRTRHTRRRRNPCAPCLRWRR